MSKTNNNPRLKAALSYADKGWLILPVHTVTEDGKCTCGKDDCSSPGKHPVYHKDDFPRGARSATSDPEIIKRAWTRSPFANIGIATGKNSFDVLDVDVNECENGNETLADFELKHGKLPDTVEQLTGGGGRQIFFQYTGKMRNAVRFAPGLDTRSDGGYIVAPPSLHASGRRYEWELSSHPDDVPLAQCPVWLHEKINGQPQQKSKESTVKVDTVDVLAGVPEGKRDNSLFRYACRLQAKGMTKEETRVLILRAAKNCSPPFPEAEALRKIESAWTYKQIQPQPLTLEFPPVMGGLAGDFAKLYSSHLEAPAHFFFMGFLVGLGTVLSTSLTVET